MTDSSQLRPSARLASLAAAIRTAVSRRRGAAPSSLANAKSILVIKLDALGDFVLVTPFLRELRRAAPQARITLLVRKIAAPLAQTCPHVDETVVCEIDSTPRALGLLRQVNAVDRFFRSALPGRRFDVAFVPRTGPDHHGAGMIARISGAPVRVGFSTAAAHPLARMTVVVPYPARAVPEAEANLTLLQAAGVPAPAAGPLELHATSKETGSILQRLSAHGLSAATPLLVLGVGASLDHKRWPADRFLRLARTFAVERGWRVVVVGDAADAQRFPQAVSEVLNWAGTLTPNESFVLLRHARLFLGNDSGALHLAAAAGCPTVVVSWDLAVSVDADVNSHRRFAPYRVPHVMVHPNSPDGRRDAALITFEQVMTACDALIASTAELARHTP